MQFDSQVFDEFAFEGEGTITGEHVHLADIAATIIKSTDDEENKIEYKENLIEVSKGLTVLGPLVAPNWTHGTTQYPADPAFNSVNCTGKINANEVEATTLKTDQLTAVNVEASGVLFGDSVLSHSSVSGTSFVSSGSIVGQEINGQTKVHAPLIEADAEVKAPVVTTTNLTATTGTIPTLNSSAITTGTITAPTISSDTLIESYKLTSKHIQMVHGNWQLDIWPGSLHMRNESIGVLSNILLDSATGKITCNGGIDCSNDNHPFDVIHARGLTADFVQTKAHKSVFGTQLINPFNMYGISIEAEGTVSTPQLVIPGSVYGTWGGINSTSVYHSKHMTAPLLDCEQLRNTDGNNSHTILDMRGSSIDVKIEGHNICSFTHDRTHFLTQVDFTGLTENDIINWPLHQHGSVLNHIIDHGHGVKILYESGNPGGDLGNLLAKNIITGTLTTGVLNTVDMTASGDVEAHKLQALDSVNANLWLSMIDSAQMIMYQQDEGLLIGTEPTQDGPTQGKSMQIKLNSKDSEPSLDIKVDEVNTTIKALENQLSFMYKEQQPPKPTPTPQPTPQPYHPGSTPADIPAAASMTHNAIAFFSHVDSDGDTKWDSHHFSPDKQYHYLYDADYYTTTKYTPSEDFKEQGTGDYKISMNESLDVDEPTGFMHKSNRIHSYKGELRRQLGQTHDFMDANGVVNCFKLCNEQTQTLHLTHEQMEALEGLSGLALKNSLMSSRNPRTIIKGSQATFGLHTNDEDAGDVHFLLAQDQASTPSFCAVKVDRQVYSVSNKEVINGAYIVDWTGYNVNDFTTKEHSGARIGINNQTSEGKLYLGRWDNMLPNNADNDNPADFSDVNIQGAVRFSGTPDNFNSGLRYAALDETLGLQVNNIQSLTQDGLTIAGDVTFTGTVHGISGSNDLPSLTEIPSAVICNKPVWSSEFGVTLQHTRYDNKIRHRGGDTELVTHYKDEHGGMYSEFFTVAVHHNDAYFTDGTGAPTIQFFRNTSQITCDNVGATTGTSNIELDHDNMVFKINGMPKFLISPDKLVGYAPWETHKFGSSGNYTHSHCMEPAMQSPDWVNRVGLAVVSSGFYQSRTDDGAIANDVSNPPGNEYATVQVALAQQGDILGIISSVEIVQDQKVLHKHGGLGIITRVNEDDGHQMIRVAGSGDIFCWVAKPSLDDCPLPILSGTYEKYVAGVHKGTVYGLEHNGVLHLDNWKGTWQGRTHNLGEGENKEIVLTDNELCIKFDVTQSSQLTSQLLSGAYTKTINGVAQTAQIIMTVNDDMSFTWTENTPSLETRIAALEQAWLEFTGPAVLS